MPGVTGGRPFLRRGAPGSARLLPGSHKKIERVPNNPQGACVLRCMDSKRMMHPTLNGADVVLEERPCRLLLQFVNV
jgi:hypothetical protein